MNNILEVNVEDFDCKVKNWLFIWKNKTIDSN
jgi:hypothetical protein